MGLRAIGIGVLALGIVSGLSFAYAASNLELGHRKGRYKFLCVLCFACSFAVFAIFCQFAHKNAAQRSITGRVASLTYQCGPRTYGTSFVVVPDIGETLSFDIPTCFTKLEAGELVVAQYAVGYSVPIDLKVLDGPSKGWDHHETDTGLFATLWISFLAFVGSLFAAWNWKKHPDGRPAFKRKRVGDYGESTSINLSGRE